MDKIKILVACHKPAKVLHDDVYTPIQVGKALHPDLDLGYITDDTGDNISSKNGNYSELTAQYWAWKNLKDVEYVGLCHYQRYFKHKITTDNIDSILGNQADLLLVKPITEWMNLGERLMMWTSREDVYLLCKCFEKVHPSQTTHFLHYLNHNNFSPFNMFVMKKKTFDNFADWQFSVFSEMEKYVRLSGYARQKRLYGYLSEVFLFFFAEINGLNVKYDSITNADGNTEESNIIRKYEFLKNNIAFNISHGFMAHKKKLFTVGYATEVGMKQDGIIIPIPLNTPPINNELAFSFAA